MSHSLAARAEKPVDVPPPLIAVRTSAALCGAVFSALPLRPIQNASSSNGARRSAITFEPQSRTPYAGPVDGSAVGTAVGAVVATATASSDCLRLNDHHTTTTRSRATTTAA